MQTINKLEELNKSIESIKIDYSNKYNKYLNEIKTIGIDINEDKYKLINNIEQEIIKSNSLINKINKSMNEIICCNLEINKLMPRIEYLKQYYEYLPTKSKWEITIDFMMIIGKYFESNKDYINVMKVNKKYQQLVSMYHFNPISDISLFENIQTQHFYKIQDINNKKHGLYQYIYWFKYAKFLRSKKDNEIFKDIYDRYVVNNITTLEEWSGLKYHKTLYDSEINGKSSKVFEKKILNHSNYYFIVVDSNNNVFGHYYKANIYSTGQNDDEIFEDSFMFTLNSNGRCGVKKFENTVNGDINTWICDDDCLYACNSYTVNEFDKNTSSFDSGISYYFNIDDSKVFTGSCESKDNPVCFTPKRVIVVEMKEHKK